MLKTIFIDCQKCDRYTVQIIQDMFQKSLESQCTLCGSTTQAKRFDGVYIPVCENSCGCDQDLVSIYTCFAGMNLTFREVGMIKGNKIMMKRYKLKITEANGTTWYDNTTWVEEPDQEDCEREYNPGCTIEIEDSEGNDIDTIST